MEEKKLLDVSWVTIFRILFIVICFYFIFVIKDILVWIIFALIISVLFNPVIEILSKRRVPRILSAVFVYSVFFGILGGLVYLMVPLFVSEIKNFTQVLPEYFEKISPSLSIMGFETFETEEKALSTVYGFMEGMTENAFSAIFIIFGGFFSWLFVVATAFFLSLEKGIIEKSLIILFPKKYESYILTIWRRCEKKVSGWFAARIIASVFVGLASYVVFLVFNINYPFSLGLLSGILNFIPYIGPAIMGLFLFFIILPIDPLKSLFVVVAFILIQQVEGTILSPILMKKIIGLPPALVLIALVIGAKLWGVLGAILIIPLIGILFEFLKEFLEKKKERETVVL